MESSVRSPKMTEFKLKFDGREVMPGDGVTTVGRTGDNLISFPDDSNVSRYHAEIELRGGEYCLIDLGSSNGTTVNGTKVSGETYLKAGDVIVLGGSSEILFEAADETDEDSDASATVDDAGGAASLPPIDAAVSQLPSLAASSIAAPAASGSNTMLLIAGGAVLVAVVVVAVAGVVYYRSGRSVCGATAVIVKPETGDVISKPTEIEVNAENAECVVKAVFTIDGEEFASSPGTPFTATLDPNEHPDLADGIDHSLGVVLVDAKGNLIPQSAGVLLAFETREVEKPDVKPANLPDDKSAEVPAGPQSKQVSLVEINKMANSLVKEFSGKYIYDLSSKQFLEAVQKKTAEFAQDGYFERAAKYRDAINVAYVREQNLDAPLGYVLAMSRSKFNLASQAGNAGLWQMNPEFVASQKYNGLCGAETLADPLQNCAARASAVYMKQMVLGVFDGDVIYAAAAFGKSTQDAGTWKAALPANRTNVWNSIKPGPERDEMVKFFAAGIVAENPQKFGLKNDRPISELYRQVM